MSAAEVPGLGHNSGDQFAATRADIKERVAAFLKAADVWEQRGELDEEIAQRANDFLAGAKRLLAEAEKARKAEKAPHMDAAKNVDAAWEPIKFALDKMIDLVALKLDRFLKAKKQKLEQEAAEARRKAEEAERARVAAEADALAAQSASARIEAEERAASHARAAEIATAQAERASGPVRVDSATGLANRRGLRVVRRAEIASLPIALAHYRDRPEIAAAILQLANAELRHAPTVRGEKQIPSIPGIIFVESQELA